MENSTQILISTNDAVGAGAVVGSVFTFMAIFMLAYCVLTIIASWKIFQKAGEPGWKAIIPIYNLYIMYKIVGMKAWFWCMLAAGVVLGIIMSADGSAYLMYSSNSQVAAFDWSSHMLTLASLIIYALFALGVDIYYSVRTSKAFGHGAGYAVGLFFLQPIFWMILGFGKSKYNKKAALSK
ncbi:hypothetical protein IKE82_02580 [Candidatus Saccharibacteria bacterium]|nr:hypothetical protein [Candidatus Saccharibacteria bacterium]